MDVELGRQAKLSESNHSATTTETGIKYYAPNRIILNQGKIGSKRHQHVEVRIFEPPGPVLHQDLDMSLGALDLPECHLPIGSDASYR